VRDEIDNIIQFWSEYHGVEFTAKAGEHLAQLVEEKFTTHNNPNVSAIKDIIDSQVESVGTPNGVYINRQQVWDCLNFYETLHLG